MSMLDKFLFETSFEAEDLGASGVEPLRKPPPPKFDEADLEQARVEGHEAGKAAGAQEAMQTIEQQISQAVNAISTEMISLSEAQVTSNERHGREMLEVALSVVRKLFPRLADKNGLTEIEAVVGDCLERLRNEPRIVIRVSDSLLDPVEARLGELAAQTGFEGKIVYLSQDGLNPGDVRVEWADGGAERDSEQLWREIDQITARMSETAQTDTETPEPSEPASGGPVPDDAAVSA
jgi:flagellar assembly protein FliH